MSFFSLSARTSQIPRGFEEFSTAYPKLVGAAEAVFQTFDALLSQHVALDPGDICNEALVTMAFGAKSSWELAFIFSAAGHLPSGFSEVRRSIEFACFAAKVAQSKKRALDWINQGDDLEARKRFALSSAIPRCYESPKYRYLRQLMVMHDKANYFGAHGNLDTLALRFQATEKGFVFSYQTAVEERSQFSSALVLTGFRLLQAFNEILKPFLLHVQKFEPMMKYASQELREVRLGMAEAFNEGSIPPNIYKTICLDDQTEVDTMFEEMIESDRQRQGKSSK
jgi:hypothetical protein